MNRVSRRQFLETAGAIGGVAFLQSCGWKPSAFRFFDEQEAGLVALIAEQIIPADDAPGATDAGVVYFIDKMLAGPYRKHQATYRTGLQRMRVTSEKMYGRQFSALNWDEQTGLLKALEANQVSPELWGDASSAGFFSLVRDHTMQGFYGSPRHGGNRDFVSFKMLGFDIAPIIGQNRYEKG